MSYLEDILKLDPVSLEININDHRTVYDTAEEKIEQLAATDYVSASEFIGDDEVLHEMVRTDTVVEVRCYPRSPVAFCAVYHYNVELALCKMFHLLVENGCGRWDK